jgi:hypothetical protein
MAEDTVEAPNTEGQEADREPGLSRTEFLRNPGSWFTPLTEGLGGGLGKEEEVVDESEGLSSLARGPGALPLPGEGADGGELEVVRGAETPEEAEMREALEKQKEGLTRRQMIRNSGILTGAFLFSLLLGDQLGFDDRILNWWRARQEKQERPKQVVKSWAGLLVSEEGLERGALASLRTFAAKYRRMPGGIDRYEIWEKSGLWGRFRMPLREEMGAVEEQLFKPLLGRDKESILALWTYQEAGQRAEVDEAIEKLFAFFDNLQGTGAAVKPTTAHVFSYLVMMNGYDPRKVLAVRLAVEKYETKGASVTGRSLDRAVYLTSLREEVEGLSRVLSDGGEVLSESGIKTYLLNEKGYVLDEVEIIYQALEILRKHSLAEGKSDFPAWLKAEAEVLMGYYSAQAKGKALSLEEFSEYLTSDRGYSTDEVKRLRLAFAILTDTVSLEELLLSLSG